MKRFLITVIFCCMNLLVNAQTINNYPNEIAEDTVADMSCDTTIIYAAMGNLIQKLAITPTTVNDLGSVTPAVPGIMAGIAYAHDITSGSNDRTLYASTFSPNQILKYDGATWLTVSNDSIIWHNAGGYGPYLYFQHVSTGTGPNDQKIARLNSNGTLTTIFSDTSLKFTVSDIAVDSSGNIYCFRGTQIAFTTELTILDPNGTIIGSYSTNLNNMGTIYGMAFFNNTLYIGQGTNNPFVFPVTWSGTTATLGSSIAISSGASYKDYANCHNHPPGITAIHENDEKSFYIYPVPAENTISIKGMENIQDATISDVYGKVIRSSFRINGSADVSDLANGIYLLTFMHEQNKVAERFIVQH